MRKSAVDRLPHSSYRFGGWGKQLLAAVLITVVIGCGQQTAETSPVEPIAQSQHTFTTNDIEVTLTQGTNLAVTVNPVDTGQRVVSLQGTLFLLNENSPAQALTNAYFDAREPQFSPDGKTVVFHGYRNGNWDLWQVNLNGGEPQSLTQDAYDDREPQYSPDGHSVVFSSDRGGSYDIWQLDLASAEVVQLTQTQGNSYSPSLSSQGLAYTQRGKTGSQVTVQGSEKDRVVVEEAGLISGVQWSADASRISYQVLQGDQAAMKVVDATTGITAVVSQPGDDVFPFRAAWLGTDQLAYAVNGLVLKGTIGAEFSDWPFSATVTITRHDYQRRQRDYDAATKRPARGLTSPTISNDGEQIYFTALGDLWQWQPSQNQLHNLTDDPAADHSPTLSPDGYQLAFVSDRSGQVGLHVLHLDGEEESAKIVQLPVVANQISYPSFSADGGQIAFFVDVPGNPLGGQLTVLDIESGLSTKVLAPMPAQIISWSSDGQKLAVTQLNPYSSRYREGMYELVVADINGQATHKIAPEPHKSIVSAVLTPDGAMSYVQGARLHRLELDENYQPVESAGQMTQELTDMPSWSANGNFLVYASGDKLKRMDLSAGGVQDVTPQLHYQLEPADDSYVIRAGRVFVGDKNNVYVLDQDIWINGNRIEKIVPRQADLAGVEIVDASDKTVVAGLFEMHAHMGETSEVQGRVWLSYGITTVRDPGSNPYVAKERQEAWDSGRRVGPRTHVTGYLTDGNRVYYSMAEGITSGQHLQDALLRTQMLGLDFIKTYVRLPDHWQAEVVNFAHDIGIPVSSHELYPAVAHGMDHVEHIGGTSRRGFQPKVSRLGYSYQDVVELLSASGMGMTATAVLPGFAVIVAEEPDWFETAQFDHFYGPQMRRAYEMMAPRFGATAGSTAQANGRLLSALTDRGALLVTGTDSPFVPYGAGLHAEFRLFSRAGVATADILRQATIGSALAAGVDAELGTVQAGKLADLVIVDGDPLENIRDLDNVVLTVKNGNRYGLNELMNPK